MTNRLRFEGLDVGYGRNSILQGVSGEVQSGRWVHLFGRNGSGKTSLLQVLASLNYPLSGTVEWNGRDVHRNRPAFRSCLRYFGHEVALYERLTVRENWDLFEGLFDVDGLNSGPLTDEIASSRLVKELSRGQKQRLELASLIASPRDLVILDEPLSSLDQAAAGVLVEHLHRLGEEGVIVLTASPDPMDHSDDNWRIANGTIDKVQ